MHPEGDGVGIHERYDKYVCKRGLSLVTDHLIDDHRYQYGDQCTVNEIDSKAASMVDRLKIIIKQTGFIHQ